MHLVKVKRWLLTEKSNNGYPFAIEKSDVVKLVALAWKESFAQKQTNMKAIAARGWNPLNYNILLHPEIQVSKTAQGGAVPSFTSKLTSTILPSNLNLSQGLAGTLMDDIVLYRQIEDARNGVNLLEQQRKRKERADAAAATHKKNMTGGQAAMMMKFRLGPEFLDHALVRKRIAAEEQDKKDAKKQKEYEALRIKVLAIRLTNKTPAELTGAQLRVMVSWYKDDVDGGAAKTNNELLTRLLETCERADKKPPFPHLATVPTEPLPPPEEQPPPPEELAAIEEPPLAEEGLNAPEGPPPSEGSLPPVGPRPPGSQTVRTFLEKQRKKQHEYESLYNKVLTLRASNKPPHAMTCAQLTVMARWFRQSKDPSIPKTRAELLTTLHATCGRVDQQPPFPHLATTPQAPPLQEQPYQPLLTPPQALALQAPPLHEQTDQLRLTPPQAPTHAAILLANPE
jgi:hypothetical protein